MPTSALIKSISPSTQDFIFVTVLGALLPFALTPFNFWPLALIVPGLLFVILRKYHRLKDGIFLGFALGLGLFGVGASWVYVSIQEHGHLAPPLAALITFLFAVLLSMFTIIKASLFIGLKRFFRADLTLIWLFATSWCFGDFCQTWLLTGYPWLFIGNIATELSFLASMAPLFGVFGVSFIIVLTSTLLVNLTFFIISRASMKQSPTIASLALLSLIGFGIAISHNIEWTHATSDNLQVGLVQANIPQDRKWQLTSRGEILTRHLKLSAPFPENTLIVWPENAVPILKQYAEHWLEGLHQEVQTKKSWLITGIPTSPSPTTLQNSLLLMGLSEGLFHKTHLVPFGEYVPLKWLLGGLFDFFNLPQSTFVEGNTQQDLFRVGSLQIAPTICYEITYPHLVANIAKESNIIVTVSNDTWFGRSIGPHQHFQQARMRAIENQKPVIRSTNNGISALIGAHGEVLLRLPQFTETQGLGKIQPRQGTTPFSRYGIFSWLFLIALAGIAMRLLSVKTILQPALRACPTKPHL